MPTPEPSSLASEPPPPEPEPEPVEPAPPTLLKRVQACGNAEAARTLWRENCDEWTAEHTAAAKALAPPDATEESA